jgi:hypothetical protein
VGVSPRLDLWSDESRRRQPVSTRKRPVAHRHPWQKLQKVAEEEKKSCGRLVTEVTAAHHRSSESTQLSEQNTQSKPKSIKMPVPPNSTEEKSLGGWIERITRQDENIGGDQECDRDDLVHGEGAKSSSDTGRQGDQNEQCEATRDEEQKCQPIKSLVNWREMSKPDAPEDAGPILRKLGEEQKNRTDDGNRGGDVKSEEPTARRRIENGGDDTKKERIERAYDRDQNERQKIDRPDVLRKMFPS